jgi:hypothetical protein
MQHYPVLPDKPLQCPHYTNIPQALLAWTVLLASMVRSRQAISGPLRASRNRPHAHPSDYYWTVCRNLWLLALIDPPPAA